MLYLRVKEKRWNRCDLCGRFIAYKDFDDGTAIRELLYPDSDHSEETHETLCSRCSSLPPITKEDVMEIQTRIRNILREDGG